MSKTATQEKCERSQNLQRGMPLTTRKQNHSENTCLKTESGRTKSKCVRREPKWFQTKPINGGRNPNNYQGRRVDQEGPRIRAEEYTTQTRSGTPGYN